MLVSGVLECTRLLFWSFVPRLLRLSIESSSIISFGFVTRVDTAKVIIGVVHFMSAVVVMETITKSELFEDDEVVQRLFGSLSYSMFTLFQFMTFDSWAFYARPAEKKNLDSILS